jgi:hypothetical protein
LQLIDGDNSFPEEQLSCCDEKNGMKFAFAVLLSLKHWKKNQTLFKLLDLLVKSARPFTETEVSVKL